MKPIDQRLAVDLGALEPQDSARFFRAARHDGLDGLTASFRKHRYAPHTHDTYVIGVITAGCETFHLNGVRLYAPAGSVCFVHPGEVHDGEPADGGYAYRMTYPSEALMGRISAELGDRERASPPRFREPVVADPELAALFVEAHRRAAAGSDALAIDEGMERALGAVVARHGDRPSRAVAAPSAEAAALARDFLAADLGRNVTLDEVAAAAGLGRFQLLRAFKKAYGMTPHAWLTDQRVLAARRLLLEGREAAEVAVSVGFFDQSHLTRAFKARLAVPPVAYVRALRNVVQDAPARAA